MKTIKKLNQKRMRRARRTKAKLFGTAETPRLAVYRSNRFITAQIIDDSVGHTLVSASSRALPKAAGKTTKSVAAFSVGEIAGKKAIEKGIKKVIFDRRSYKFHGRVKNVADGAKKSGLTI
jgi:large subunit ribosomal protein L18